MGKTKSRKSKVYASFAAINTLLERYPVLTTTDSMLNNVTIQGSLGFLLGILDICGISQNDIVKWLCKILGDGEFGGGLLNVIEHAIKGVLLSTVTDLLTCSINPFLPDSIMKYANQTTGKDPGSEPIRISLSAIDLFGIFSNCPSNEDGSIYYFDAYESGYKPKDLYKSQDFNAFLWYVIYKGDITNPTNVLKNTWDNRVKASKVYNSSKDLKEAFFNPELYLSGDKKLQEPTVVLDVNGNQCEKKQYLICEYNENNGGELDIWLNANRYYKSHKIDKTKPLFINSTFYEFNYDYIYSLKLFDTKTLLANICNSLLVQTSGISISLSHERQFIREKVQAIVTKIMNQDDDDESESDCYFTFSNDEYNELLTKATDKYSKRYTTTEEAYNPNYKDVFDSIRNINSGESDAKKQESLTEKAIDSIFNAACFQNSIDNTFKFNYNIDFIHNFLEHTITEIILSVLSPKVIVIYAINSYLIGDLKKINSWGDLIDVMLNALVSAIKQIKDILIKALYDYVISQIKPLLQLFISKLALETIKYYKDIITNLILNCIPTLPMFYGNGNNSVIDNVQYADIVPSKDKPGEINNC